MPTTTFLMYHSGNSGDIRTQSALINLPRRYGDVIPKSNVVIKKARFTVSSINIYSDKYIYVQVGGSRGSDNEWWGTDNYRDIYYDLYTTLGLYAGLESINIRLVVAFPPEKGSVFNIRATSEIKIVVDWEYAYTACSPPSTLGVSASLTEGNVILSGSGAAGGTQNNITGYLIQYADSADGSAWSAWRDYATVSTNKGEFSHAVAPNPTRGHYRKFRVKTKGAAGSAYDSGWKESGVVRKNQLPGKPSNLVANPTVYESGDIGLSWGTSTDPDNNLKDYELQYSAYYPNNNVYKQWTYEKMVTGTSTKSSYDSLPRGYKAKWRMRARDALGAYSDWIESNFIVKNSLPNKISALKVSKTIFESGGIGVSWEKPTDPDNNYRHQKLQYQINGGTWLDWGTNTGTSSTHYPSVSAGGTVRYRSASVDTLGAMSDWVYSPIVKRNTPPQAIVVRTMSNRTIYNAKETILDVYCPKDADGDAITLKYTVNNGAVKSFVPEKQGEYYFEGRFIPVGIGANTFTLWLEDSRGGVGAKTSIAVNIQDPKWSREITTGDIIANKEISHVADINELVSRLNTCRAFYALASISLPYKANLLARWKANMLFILSKILETAQSTGRTWNDTLQAGEQFHFPNAGDFNLLRDLIAKL